MEEVKEKLKRNFEKVFDAELKDEMKMMQNEVMRGNVQ